VLVSYKIECGHVFCLGCLYHTRTAGSGREQQGAGLSDTAAGKNKTTDCRHSHESKLKVSFIHPLFLPSIDFACSQEQPLGRVRMT